MRHGKREVPGRYGTAPGKLQNLWFYLANWPIFSRHNDGTAITYENALVIQE